MRARREGISERPGVLRGARETPPLGPGVQSVSRRPDWPDAIPVHPLSFSLAAADP